MSPKTPNANDRHIGARIKARRQQLDISQDQLAERLNVTFQQVQKYEKGINRVGASRLFEIASVLKAPIGYFYEGLETSTPEPSNVFDPIGAFLNMREGVELARTFVEIENPAIRRALVDMARAATRLRSSKKASKKASGESGTPSKSHRN